MHIYELRTTNNLWDAFSRNRRKAKRHASEYFENLGLEESAWVKVPQIHTKDWGKTKDTLGRTSSPSSWKEVAKEQVKSTPLNHASEKLTRKVWQTSSIWQDTTEIMAGNSRDWFFLRELHLPSDFCLLRSKWVAKEFGSRVCSVEVGELRSRVMFTSGLPKASKTIRWWKELLGRTNLSACEHGQKTKKYRGLQAQIL